MTNLPQCEISFSVPGQTMERCSMTLTMLPYWSKKAHTCWPMMKLGTRYTVTLVHCWPWYSTLIAHSLFCMSFFVSTTQFSGVSSSMSHIKMSHLFTICWIWTPKSANATNKVVYWWLYNSVFCPKTKIIIFSTAFTSCVVSTISLSDFNMWEHFLACFTKGNSMWIGRPQISLLFCFWVSSLFWCKFFVFLGLPF